MANHDSEIKAAAEYMKKKAHDLVEESVESQPNRLSEINVELTSIKAFFSEQLDNILVMKADRMQDLKKENKTVSAAKLAWNASPEGKNEILLRGIIGRIKDSVSANKGRLNVMRDNAWGQY